MVVVALVQGRVCMSGVVQYQLFRGQCHSCPHWPHSPNVNTRNIQQDYRDDTREIVVKSVAVPDEVYHLQACGAVSMFHTNLDRDPQANTPPLRTQLLPLFPRYQRF